MPRCNHLSMWQKIECRGTWNRKQRSHNSTVQSNKHLKKGWASKNLKQQTKIPQCHSAIIWACEKGWASKNLKPQPKIPQCHSAIIWACDKRSSVEEPETATKDPTMPQCNHLSMWQKIECRGTWNRNQRSHNATVQKSEYVKKGWASKNLKP